MRTNLCYLYKQPCVQSNDCYAKVVSTSTYLMDPSIFVFPPLHDYILDVLKYVRGKWSSFSFLSVLVFFTLMRDGSNLEELKKSYCLTYVINRNSELSTENKSYVSG